MGLCGSTSATENSVVIENIHIERLESENSIYIRGQYDGRWYYCVVPSKMFKLKNAKRIRIFYSNMVQTGVHLMHLQKVTRIQRP